MAPRTRYARSGDLPSPTRSSGRGPLDLVLAPGFVSHLDWAGRSPAAGVPGAAGRVQPADPVRQAGHRPVRPGRPARPRLEERVEDLAAVMDAAGSERAAVLGVSEGGAMAMLFAAQHPERTPRPRPLRRHPALHPGTGLPLRRRRGES